MDGLTDRQRQVLDFIVEFVSARGRPPSIRGLCRHLGITTNAVADLLSALERKGAIVREPYDQDKKFRTIRIPGVRWVPTATTSGG